MKWFFKRCSRIGLKLVRLANRHIVQDYAVDREEDGRWIVEVTRFPGVMAYGDTLEEAMARVQELLPRFYYL